MYPPKYVLELTKSLVILLILLNSCAVEKRHFNKGYHVEWYSHQNNKQKSSSDETVSIEAEKNYQINQDESKVDVQSNEYNLDPELERNTKIPVHYSGTALIDDNSQGLNVINPKNDALSLTEKKIFSKTDLNIKPEEAPKKKLEPFGVFSLIGLLIISGSLLGEAYVVAIVILPVVLIFSIVSIIRTRRDKEKYWGRWMGWVSIWLLTVLLVIGLLALIAYLSGAFWGGAASGLAG